VGRRSLKANSRHGCCARYGKTGCRRPSANTRSATTDASSVDFAYPHAKLVIEAYGRRHHSVWTDQEHDLARQNDLITAGWRVIIVTWWRLQNERQQLMRTIARALAD
jgi:very-short-patch-repair endonuclease